jgi:hypothetical protein
MHVIKLAEEDKRVEEGASLFSFSVSNNLLEIADGGSTYQLL